MGGNEEEEEIDVAIKRLPPLLSLPPLSRSAQHSGTLTPPLHTEASVPFLWEEEPGKPLPCTALALPPPSPTAPFIDGINKCLDLPPRLLNEAAKSSSSSTKTPSPTTVLEGPYPYTSRSRSRSRSLLESSSLRFLSLGLRIRRHSSFDDPIPFEGNRSRGSSPDRGLLGAMVLSNSRSNTTKTKTNIKEKGLLGSWRRRPRLSSSSVKVNHSQVDRDNLVSSTFSDDTTTIFTRNTTLSTLSCSNSHFWDTIYGAFKQVIPRRSTKWRNNAL